ncbi:MAG TPA: homoserine O-acetyltransferase [Rhizomicrobium sp.]|jgi:homoserine O-acetyltransferase|nr:homoserine O-acetyltransferase [Rhizomicrobium sp.]
MAKAVEPHFPRMLQAPEAPRGYALEFDETLPLACGRTLTPFTVAYQTYGKLNRARSNAILVCHALSGDQFVAGTHPVTGRAGWWETMVGPGKAIDTERYYVLCPNVIGGCMGSTGPADLNPANSKPYALDFPVVTVADIVRAQAMLLDALGIERLLCVTGGSMGGMQALQWAAAYPDRVVSAIPVATAARHTAQNIALHEIGRQAIMADSNWYGGRYLERNVRPEKGLAIARMIGHISYLSEEVLARKFGRSLQNRNAFSFAFELDFQVESYLRHQGSSFVERFDANSYLYITRAMDYFDLAAEYGGNLANVFQKTKARFLIISFTSDWLFPTSENRLIAAALHAAGNQVEFREIESYRGHDAFLLDEPHLSSEVRKFLSSAASEQGLP